MEKPVENIYHFLAARKREKRAFAEVSAFKILRPTERSHSMLQSLLASYSEKVKNEKGKSIGYVYEELWTEYASALLGKVFLYAALFLLAAFIVVGVFTRRKKAEQFNII